MSKNEYPKKLFVFATDTSEGEDCGIIDAFRDLQYLHDDRLNNGSDVEDGDYILVYELKEVKSVRKEIKLV